MADWLNEWLLTTFVLSRLRAVTVTGPVYPFNWNKPLALMLTGLVGAVVHCTPGMSAFVTVTLNCWLPVTTLGVGLMGVILTVLPTVIGITAVLFHAALSQLSASIVTFPAVVTVEGAR